MSQENVEIVRRLVDAINADAIPRDLIAPDFELRNATTAITDATYLGYEGGLKWRRDLFEGVDDAQFVLDEVLATGPDYVVITNSLVGHGSSSGVPIELRWVSVLWFRDNRSGAPSALTDAARPSRPWGCRSSPGPTTSGPNRSPVMLVLLAALCLLGLGPVVLLHSVPVLPMRQR